MGFYQDQIVPLLINWSMRQKNLAAYRARIIPAAEGRVLEIGIGSGLNLPFYSRTAARALRTPGAGGPPPENRRGSRTHPAVLFAQRCARDRPRTLAEALGHGT